MGQRYSRWIMSEVSSEKTGRYLPALRRQFTAAATWAESRARNLDGIHDVDSDAMLLAQFMILDQHVKSGEAPGISLQDRRDFNWHGALIAAHSQVLELVDRCRAEIREIDQTDAGKEMADDPSFSFMDELDAHLDKLWPEWRSEGCDDDALLSAIGHKALLD